MQISIDKLNHHLKFAKFQVQNKKGRAKFAWQIKVADYQESLKILKGVQAHVKPTTKHITPQG